MGKLKDSEYFWTNVISLAMCFVPILIGIVVYSSMPAQMPIHFNSHNEADDYASKGIALFGIPLFLVAVQFILCFIMENDEKRKNAPKPLQYFSRMIVPICSIMAQVLTVLYVYRDGKLDVSSIAMLVLDLILMIIGIYIPKCKINNTIGFRFSWTLDNEIVWNKTHKLAGIVMIIGGAAMIGCILAKITWLFFVILVLELVIPIIYSFIVARMMSR